MLEYLSTVSQGTQHFSILPRFLNLFLKIQTYKCFPSHLECFRQIIWNSIFIKEFQGRKVLRWYQRRS